LRQFCFELKLEMR